MEESIREQHEMEQVGQERISEHHKMEQVGQESMSENSKMKQAGQESMGERHKMEQTGQESIEKHQIGNMDGLLTGILEMLCGEAFQRGDIRTYSPLTLAYIGDAVYDLIIRTVVVERANRPANELHKITVKYVSANAQSKIVQALMDSFTEEEQAVYRRGKNAKPHTTAKNASHADYMKATGFEAVIGYLYLTGNMARALELVKIGIACGLKKSN